MRKTVLSFIALIAMLSLSASYALAQFQYIFPTDGAVNEDINTHLILRNGALMDETSITSDKITLTGSKSGVIATKAVLSTDGKTVCITPVKPFAYSETVTVQVKGLKTSSGEELTEKSFSFSIRRELTETEKQSLQEYLSTHDDDGNLLNDPNQQSTYVPYDNTERDTKFDFVNIYVNNNPTPGEIFFHENSGNSPTASSGIGYGIMESNGDSVFYRESASDGANFRLNLNGYLTAYRLNAGVDTGTIVMDSSYNIINVLHEPHGQSQHEQLFLSTGYKWFSVYDWQGGWDLSSYGGNSQSIVNVSRIIEVDPAGNQIFNWRSDQHFQILDAAPDILTGIGAPTFDPWHLNSLSLEPGGASIIASFRNMDRILKIGVPAGNIIWQWGGMNSTYTDFTTTSCGSYAFSHEHNVHRLDNGHILLFDNGNGQPSNVRTSRPEEYVLDEVNLTATCFWFYAHPQVNNINLFTKNQGSVQRLSNGNTFICYGLPDVQGLPNGTEIDPSGNIVWEFRFKDSTEYSYRLYKENWSPTVGIGNIKAEENNLHVFPNPSDGVINLDVDLQTATKVSIEVINLLGQTMFSKTEDFHSGTNLATLDLTALHKGFYILNVSTDNMKKVSRILIQ